MYGLDSIIDRHSFIDSKGFIGVNVQRLFFIWCSGCYLRGDFYCQVKLGQVHVGLKIAWVQDQVGCCHFVTEI